MNRKYNKQERQAVLASAAAIDKQPQRVRKLIISHGIMLRPNASKREIERAFHSLLKTSKTFRRDFAQVAADVLSESDGSYSNFFGRRFKKKDADNPIIEDSDIEDPETGETTSTGNKSVVVDNKERRGRLGEYLSPEVVKQIINTGLNIWAAKSGTTPADTSNDLDDGRDDNGASDVGRSGIGVTGLVVGGLVAATLVGVGIYFWYKNSKK